MVISGIREASRLIFIDELTGLYNRRFMRQYLQQRLEALARQQTPLAVIMLDLDGFKQVNDTYGHLEGDFVLKRMAQLLREALPPSGYAIRFAGDEFVAFLEGVDAAGGVRAAEAIRERVNAEPFATAKAPAGIPVRISLGVAAYPEDAAGPGELIEAADQALYRSKRTGKNCVSRAGGWSLPPELEVLKRFPCPRLVGREAELQEMERPLADRADSRNRLLLVEGDRGMGKSRLLAEVMRRAGRRGLRCFSGRCLESRQAMPYSSLTPLLADCLTREPEQLQSITTRLSNPTVVELGTILPGLATSTAGREPLLPEDRRSLLFHGMGDLLCLLSEQAPLFLFLDDVQFVDEASLEVLYRLLDREDGSVVVYTAAQSETLAPHEGTPLPLVRLLGLLRQSSNFLRVNLTSVSLPQVTQMVTDILERTTPSPDFFQRLYEASGGVPLFVEETLKGLVAKGALKTADGVWNLGAGDLAAVPATLEAAVLGGLEALDRDIHAMIAKASVVGPHVDLDLLAGLLGKDPGETQQLVDEGKKQRVFEEPGPLADENEVRFLSQCFQQIVYSHLDRDNRRQTHRVVGEVAERLAGTRVEEIVGPLAYHFERSDDAAKAEFYRRRVQELSGQLFSAAEVASDVGLKVGIVDPTFPLDEEGFPLAERLLRALTVAVKSMRVYPEGSQLVADSVAAAAGTLLELLSRVEAVTFAEENQALLANGRPVESKGLLPVAQDLLRVYAEHGIRRCSFQRGTTQADVLGLLKILSGPPLGIQHDVAFWEQRLDSEGIAHVRVLPVIFLATAEGKAVWSRERKEARLDDLTLALARDVLRSLAAAVDNIRLYPPESQLITLTLDQLERQAQALFARVPSLTVGMAEGTLVINATRPNPRTFGITIEILQKLMEDSGLTSLTLRRGVGGEELRLFLAHLAQTIEEEQRSPTFWRNLLEGRGITTIEVGTRTYAAVTYTGAAKIGKAEILEPEFLRSEAAPAGPAEISTAVPPQVSSGISAADLSEAELTLRRVSQWLGEPLETFLERQVQEDIPPVLGTLRRLGKEDLARQLVARITGALEDPEGSVRHRAARALAICLRGREEEAIDWLLVEALEPLCAALRKETRLEAFQAELEPAAEALKRLVRDADLSRGARLAEALGGTAQQRGDQEKFDEAVKRLVDSLAAARAFQPVLTSLKDADPARRRQASAGGVGRGRGSILDPRAGARRVG